MTDLKFKTFKGEAIINFPNIEVKARRNFQTGEETQALNFSTSLFFATDVATVAVQAYDEMKAANPNAKSSLKTIKSIKDSYLSKSNDADESDKVREKNKSYFASLDENLPKEYTHALNVNGWVDKLESIDLYKKSVSLDDLKSGDKVFVKVLLLITKYKGKEYISNRLNLICKLKEKEVKFFTGSDNSDAYDALDKYKVHDSDPEKNWDDEIK